MDNEDIVSVLADLAQLDIDAMHAYQQALKNIDDDEIYHVINSFRDDHIHHIDELNVLIDKYDGEILEKTQDFKGYIIEGFTSLRSITGTEGALKAMETNEILTNKKYRSAVEQSDLPADVRSLLHKNYGDEQRHLDYIRSALKTLNKKVSNM